MAEIEISPQSAKRDYAYGEPLRLSYQVKNLSRRTLFIVRDRVYRQKSGTNKLRVLVGELDSPADYFEYRAPALGKLASGQTSLKRVSVGMPITESVVGADGLVHEQEVPLDGAVEVTLSLGYGDREFKPRTADPRGEFMRWQKVATSKAITITIKGP